MPQKTEVPVEPMPRMNLRYEPSFIAPGLDVDQVHAILREAESGDTRNLFCIYRDMVLSDAHTQQEFAKRKLAVLGDAISFVPADRTSADDAQAAEAVRAMVAGCANWINGCSHILESSLYPVSVTEKLFRPGEPGEPTFVLTDLLPVPHHLITFTAGKLQILDVAPDGTILPTAQDPDPSRYIIHRGHLLSTPDNWGGPMRSILFWWLLSTMSREWWARFLDRYGSPFPVGKYEAGDDQSRGTLERAFALSVKIGGLVVTKNTEVELQQVAAAASSEAYERFITICQREKSKLILGQTLSAEAQSTGLGSGVSEQHETVRQDIRQFDSVSLSLTLTHQLVKQYLQINGVRGKPPLLVWGSQTAEEIRSTVSLLQSLSAANLEPTDEGITDLSTRVGIQLRRRSTSPGLPGAFTAREVGAVNPFSAEILPPFRRRR